jgi:hypothetical protein
MDGGGGEANVWACIMNYRHDKAEELLKAFGTSAAIINKLKNYPLKDSYHGHRSGGGGDGTNPGADKNLNTAIAFLETNKPSVVVSQVVTKGPNLALKNASQNKTEVLLDLIRKEDNLGTLVSQLDAADPNWRKNRNVWQSYSVKYFAKKGKYPQN